LGTATGAFCAQRTPPIAIHPITAHIAHGEAVLQTFLIPVEVMDLSFHVNGFQCEIQRYCAEPTQLSRRWPRTGAVAVSRSALISMRRHTTS
jgi:hypothetical protein